MLFHTVADVTDSLERYRVSRPSFVQAVAQTPSPRAATSGPGWCPTQHCCCSQMFPRPHSGLPVAVIVTCVLVSGPMNTNPEGVSDEVAPAHTALPPADVAVSLGLLDSNVRQALCDLLLGWLYCREKCEVGTMHT